MTAVTTKIFNEEDDYITLFELSKSQRYGLEYLLQAASSGKLKSFKIGDDWMTTLDWFDDYKKNIKKSIQLEIADKETGQKNDWVDFLEESTWRLKFVPQMVAIFVIFSIFSFSLSWLTTSPNGNNLARRSSGLVEAKYLVGDYFLHYTNQVVNYNYQFFSFVIDSSSDVTSILNYSLVSVGHDTAYLALVVDQKIGQYKISDEIITQQASRFTSVLKDKYQQVAGAKSIKTQIYYEDWQKSSDLDN